jgi:hypothetical protein
MRAEEPPLDLDLQVDVVEHGVDRPRRRVPASVWVRVLVPLLLAGAVVAYVLDERARQQEYADLQERLVAAEEAVDVAQSSVVAIKQYVAPQLFSAEVPETLRRDLVRLVRGTAAEAAGDLAEERERTLALDVLPWHGAQAAARDALVDYLDERRGRLETVLADTSSEDEYPAHDLLAAALAAAAADADSPAPGPP